MFDFKNPEGQNLFREITTNTQQLSECFQDNASFEQQSRKWFKRFNQIIHQSFTKIRQRKRKLVVSSVDILLEERKKLRRANSIETVEDYQQKIVEVEDKIRKITR